MRSIILAASLFLLAGPAMALSSPVLVVKASVVAGQNGVVMVQGPALVSHSSSISSDDVSLFLSVRGFMAQAESAKVKTCKEAIISIVAGNGNVIRNDGVNGMSADIYSVPAVNSFVCVNE